LENEIYIIPLISSCLKSLPIYSSNFEKKITEYNSKYESLPFNKSDIQIEIIHKKEEFHAEIANNQKKLENLSGKPNALLH
jgi:hypothetical protein